MNHAADGRSMPAWQQAHMDAQPQAGLPQASGYGGYAAPGPTAPAAHQYKAAAEELTLRQLVESFAADNDIQLLPKAGQMEEGLQVGCNIGLALSLARLHRWTLREPLNPLCQTMPVTNSQHSCGTALSYDLARRPRHA